MKFTLSKVLITLTVFTFFTPILAQETNVNLEANGLTLRNEGGVWYIDANFSFSMDNVLQPYETEGSLSGFPAGPVFFSISFGAVSDGTNSVNGGAACSGSCKIYTGPTYVNGTCVRDGLSKDGILQCVCSAGSTKSVQLPSPPISGMVFSLQLDPNNLVPEYNETDNSLTLRIP